MPLTLHRDCGRRLVLSSAAAVISFVSIPTALGDSAPKSDAPPLRERIDPILERLLEVYERNQVDYVNDSPKVISGKRSNIRRVLGDLDRATFEGYYDPEPHVLHYVMYRNEASPRLSGRVVRVGGGPDANHETLEGAILNARLGDLLLLGTGVFQLPDTRSLANRNFPEIAIVGAGRDVTTVQGGRAYHVSPTRLRLEGFTFDLSSNALINLDDRSGGRGVHLRDLLINNYNSGAGGSNAISSTGAVAMLIELCTFDGASGRAAATSHRGNAFRSGRDEFIWLRHSQFIDNREVVRSVSNLVLDGCIITSSAPYSTQISGTIYRRESTWPDMQTTRGDTFTLATDDHAFVLHILGRNDDVDDRSRRIATVLHLHRSLPYWIGLLRHEDVKNRRAAVAHLKRLVPDIEIPEEAEVVRDDPGSLRDLGPLFKAEVAFTKVMDWYERHRARLRWDDEAQKYDVLEEKPIVINEEPTGYDTATDAARAFVKAASDGLWRPMLYAIVPPSRDAAIHWARRIGWTLALGPQPDAAMRDVFAHYGFTREWFDDLSAEARSTNDQGLANSRIVQVLDAIEDNAQFFVDVLTARADPRGEGMPPSAIAFAMAAQKTSEDTAEFLLMVGDEQWSLPVVRINGRWFVGTEPPSPAINQLFDAVRIMHRWPR